MILLQHPKIEELRDQFAREADPAKQKAIAEAVKIRATETVTHSPLGQWYQRSLMRKNLVGMLQAPAPVFWNVEMQWAQARQKVTLYQAAHALSAP
jgi:ABC-type transport system substrate-binding protein